jgi:hypothetical protein
MFLPRFCRRSLGVAVAAALLASARAGLAQAPTPSTDGGAASPLGLIWASSEPSCDGSLVAARALELVRKGVTPRPTEARAQVGREGDHWVVDLQTRSQSHIGRRTLRGESCKEIQQAIALLLAMIMESEGRDESIAPAPAAAVPPPAPVSLNITQEPELDEAPPAVRPPEPASGSGFVLRAEAAAAWGVQPSLGFGVGGSLGVAWGPLEMYAGGSYWPYSRGPALNRNGLLEVSRRVVAAGSCLRVYDGGSFQILPCLTPELMWLKWRSSGLALNDGDLSKPLFALSAARERRMQLVGPMFATLSPGLTWEQTYQFMAKECEDCADTPFFQTWAVGPRLGAGIGARF